MRLFYIFVLCGVFFQFTPVKATPTQEAAACRAAGHTWNFRDFGGCSGSYTSSEPATPAAAPEPVQPETYNTTNVTPARCDSLGGNWSGRNGCVGIPTENRVPAAAPAAAEREPVPQPAPPPAAAEREPAPEPVAREEETVIQAPAPATAERESSPVIETTDEPSLGALCNDPATENDPRCTGGNSSAASKPGADIEVTLPEDAKEVDDNYVNPEANQGSKSAINTSELDKIPENLTMCEEKNTSAGNCCKDLSSGQCEAAGVGEYISIFKKTIATMQQAAYFTNSQAVCQANKQALNAQSALSAISIGICTKQIFNCTSACKTNVDCKTITTNPTLKLQCEELKKLSRECKFLASNVALENGLETYVSKATADAQKCANQTIDDGQSLVLNCEDPETAKTTPGCLEYICQQPEEMANNPLCREINPTVGQKPIEGTDDLSSNGNTDTSALDNPPENPFAPDLDQSFQGVDPSLIGGGGGGSGAPGSGTSALPGGGSGDGSGGGSGGGQGNSAIGGKDGKIIRGTGGGKGYISRFSGGGGGGAYAGRGSGASDGGRSIASASKFNLKKFLQKGMPIKKGPLKGFTRFPSGQLMVPQNKDIFEVHHQSYVNACNRNQTVKGCEFNNRKKLGFGQTITQLNGQYRAQLSLQKENKIQMLSRSGIKVKTLKNNLNSNSRKTYYMIQYMKRKRLQRVPAKDPYAALSGKSKNLIKYNKSKYASWHKMQAWVNQYNRPRKAGKKSTFKNQNRLPASVKK